MFKVIENTAELLVSTGLRDAGYNYLIMDEGWQAMERDQNGQQQPNTTKLPDGVAGIAEFVHNKGLKLGIYSDAGIYDCGFYPGSWGYEERDAATYAEWGVDYLKYDNCGGFQANTESPQVRFAAMRDALKNTGRNIFYSICQWGHQFPWYWADVLRPLAEISQSYRMSGDITDVFSDTKADCACKTAYCLNVGYAGCSVLTIIRKMRELSLFQKPGAWADMDMLEIGNGNMTLYEQQTHLTFWAALKSPLILGADLQTLSEDTLDVLKNKEIISISQDALGQAVNYLSDLSVEKSTQIWAGPLTGGKVLILGLNELANTTDINIPLGDIPGLVSNHAYSVRDIWGKQNLGRVVGNVTLQVATHQTKALVLS
ncbi:Alpha-galactosidase alpha-n-acetylgalactosaminidase [Penicillium canariense]|uniref:Alpha-galactosidase n=1 Tax=Penicillium canariense TaxID=189055 RepID=A0A9W9LCI2_9EURO|nr:Alpha-galactosidase alpha-n-acetylgalactosaminidase [Penicillium canariense]KAJ5150345.1 Alpha-galactosidase alpha-n-acetylgalactosaminidase [Penicillium canariense]